ncbi:MAG: nitroreductase family protein [Planctomycetota bacterium]|nr:nitroreductase family protein [Planctomycetota bacterium]
MSELMSLLRKRRSIRRFASRPVERELIEECLEAARLAPSAENSQPWRFVVVDETELKKRICNAAFSGLYRVSRWAADAPVLVVALARLDIITNRVGSLIQGTQYYLLDMAIAGEHFVLKATELGLGTCWIGWFNSRSLRRALKLSRRFRIAYLLALGYPAESPPSRSRKPLDEIGFFNTIPKD